MGADKQKAETAQFSTVIGLGLAIAMIVVGVQYEAGTDPNKFCTFSAVDYLYYGGILSLIANGIGILSSIGKWCAMRDGHISAGITSVLVKNVLSEFWASLHSSS
jgi:hypothetical protein